MGNRSENARNAVTTIDVVVVHYHTAALLAECVATVHRILAGSGLIANVIVVDNGSSPQDQDLLGNLDAAVISPSHNLGYAGGVNCGAEAGTAEYLMIMNADVLILPGCLEHLVTELRAGAAAAGPTLFWDRACSFLLPPTEPVERLYILERTLAQLSMAASRHARAKWRRHAWRHWQAPSTIRSVNLSGALLAIRRDAWQQTGGFDLGFKLYFEEIDWLLRVNREGVSTVFVPSAKAVHVYNQSAPQQNETERWRAESYRRFARRHVGTCFARATGFLSFVGNHLSARRDTCIPSLGDRRPVFDLRHIMEDVAAVEVAEPTLGFPAAAQFFNQDQNPSWQLPEEIWHSLAPGTYLLQFVAKHGRELQRASFQRNQFVRAPG